MKFTELPKEVQSFIISCLMLIDKVEMTLDDELIRDDYNIETRLKVCRQHYQEMRKSQGLED